MSIGYANLTNALAGLAATAFTWSSGFTANRGRLNDGVQDELAAGSASAQASGQTLTMDLGAATALVGFALLNHNLASGACAVQVQGADDLAFTTGVVTAKSFSTIATNEPFHRDSVLQFPAVSKRYWRLTFTHSGSKIITLGELYAFTSVTTLSRNSAYGSYEETEAFITNSSSSRTGTVRRTFVAGPIRSIRMGFRDLNQAQRNELWAMWRATKGGVLNLLLVENVEPASTGATNSSQQCLWGKLQESMSFTNDDFNLFSVDALELRGLGREVGA